MVKQQEKQNGNKHPLKMRKSGESIFLSRRREAVDGGLWSRGNTAVCYTGNGGGGIASVVVQKQTRIIPV